LTINVKKAKPTLVAIASLIFYLHLSSH